MCVIAKETKAKTEKKKKKRYIDVQSKKRETRTVEGNALLSPVVDISACPVGLD